MSAKIRVNVFPGIQHLALFVGVAKGFFAQKGLDVELQFTPSSQAQRDGLARGQFEMAHSAVDNAVAMVEMSGADVMIVLGGDWGMTQLFVQSYVGSVRDLRDRIVIVDAPNTAYALQIKKILLVNGLKAGEDYELKPFGGTRERLKAMQENREYAASMLFPPYSFLAAQAGLKSLGLAVKWIGPYQDTGAFVLRKWAQSNGAMLEKYIQAYVESLRWALKPVNKSEAVEILAGHLKLAPDIAAEAYEYARNPIIGLAPDARFDVEGFKNVLALRAEIEGQRDGKAQAPEKYFDLTYYQRALGTIEGGIDG